MHNRYIAYYCAHNAADGKELNNNPAAREGLVVLEIDHESCAFHFDPRTQSGSDFFYERSLLQLTLTQQQGREHSTQRGKHRGRSNNTQKRGRASGLSQEKY